MLRSISAVALVVNDYDEAVHFLLPRMPGVRDGATPKA